MADRLTPEEIAEIERYVIAEPWRIGMAEQLKLLAHIRALEADLTAIRQERDDAVNAGLSIAGAKQEDVRILVEQRDGDVERLHVLEAENDALVAAALDTYDRLEAAEKRAEQEQAIVETARTWRDTYYDLDAEPADLERAGNAVIAAVDALDAPKAGAE